MYGVSARVQLFKNKVLLDILKLHEIILKKFFFYLNKKINFRNPAVNVDM